MSKTMKIKAKIKKVSREDGKPEAIMQVLIPISSSAEVPMGMVNLTIEIAQLSMLEEKKPFRGNKG